MRGSLARADAEATRKAKAAAADAKKSRRDGAIPPLPIPPDVLASAQNDDDVAPADEDFPALGTGEAPPLRRARVLRRGRAARARS